MLNRTQERIAHFQARGIKPSQIATIVGCTPAYISQLQQNSEYLSMLEGIAKAEDLKAEEDIEEAAIGSKYLALEHKILQQIENQMPYAEFPQLVRSLEVVSSRQEKRADRLARLKQPSTPTVQNNIAVLMLPASTAEELKSRTVDIGQLQKNASNEIVGVGDRSLAPMSSLDVQSMFRATKAAIEENTKLVQESEAF